MKMKRAVAILVVVAFLGSLIPLFGGCAGMENVWQSGGAVGVIGAITGALLDKKSRWRGGLIGGVVGAAVGASVAAILKQASAEAAAKGKTVVYKSEDGEDEVRAIPIGRSAKTGCKVIREQVYEGGKLMGQQMKEVCPDS